ncbi:MAG TPA: hypothetical protein VGD60_04070 [Candidatus Acidoferrales bacterium]
MASQAAVARDANWNVNRPVRNEAHSSGVSWAAIVAGGFVAAALSLILLALGSGIGLSSISPWSNAGASATAVGRGAIIWFILMQIVSSTMGGYLGGRLRTKWVNVHNDEVFFRDTAHGFLVWAVALVLAAGFLGSAAARMAGEARAEGGSAGAARIADANPYYVDALLRSAGVTPDSGANSAAVREEVGVILANGIRRGELPDYDAAYLAQVISARTGLSPADAQARVTQVFDQARQTADTARKAIAHSLYWLFLALLVGAFCASYAATVGGRQRDRVVEI